MLGSMSTCNFLSSVVLDLSAGRLWRKQFGVDIV